MLERIVTNDGFENYEDSLLLPLARWENRNASMGSPFMMTPPPRAPASMVLFAVTMGSPSIMMPTPPEPLAPSYKAVDFGSPHPSCGVPAAPSAFALDRPCTYDRFENDDVPSPRGLLWAPIRAMSEVLSSSPSFESPLSSPRSEIGNSPSSVVGEESHPWQAKDDAAPFVPATPLCGNGLCKPCYDHIRGRCVKDSCAYCHMPTHATRRKQKKHQRRHEMQIETKTVDARPGVGGMGAPLEAKCCAGNHHGQVHTGASCQPCFKHIRGQCALGVSCHFCHDKIHADRHKHKAQVRSSQRTSNRYVGSNGLGDEI